MWYLLRNANVTTNGNNPHYPDSPQVGTVSIFPRYYDLNTDSYVRQSATTSFPFGTYNDITSTTTPLPSVANQRWVAHRIYLFSDSNNTVLQYGQRQYFVRSQCIEDLENVSYLKDPDLETNAVFRGWVVCRGGETDTGGDWEWFAPSNVGGGSSATAGLVSLQDAYDGSIDDGDNHLYYLTR